MLFALIANFTALKTVVLGGADAACIEAVVRLQIFVQAFVLPLHGTLVAMCLHGLVFSHRVVGPIYQFREASHELAEHGETLAESGHLPPEDQVKLLQLTTASTRLRQLADGDRLEAGEGASEPDRSVRKAAGASA